MATELKVNTASSSLLYFVAILLVLVGLYGVIRMAHIAKRGVPYPSAGVYPSNILFDRIGSMGYLRESDCRSYPQLYYQTDAKTLRKPTNDELALQDEITTRCVDGFNEDRAKTQQYDRNLSAFTIFIGVGLLFANRYSRLIS